jgi:hypothetical protein
MSWRLILGTLAVAFFASGCAPTYSAAPFKFKVVDADTGEPLEGVIANALWLVEDRRGEGLGFLTATEAVSDKDGYVEMPGWGPRKLTRKAWDPFAQARMDPNQPKLQLYKRDYAFFENVPSSDTGYLSDPTWTGESVRVAAWNNSVIKLKRFSGRFEVYVNMLAGGQTAGTTLAGCLWHSTPRMTAAFLNEAREAERHKIFARFFQLSDLKPMVAGVPCGSKDIVRQYLQP